MPLIENEVIAESMEENIRSKKRKWGALTGRWVPHDPPDQIVDYVNYWKDRTGLTAKQLLEWIELPANKFGNWKTRYGQINEHNGKIPRD